MAFVIFCPKHRKIAASDNFDTQRELAIWWPLVYLSSNIKKRLTVEESISLILSEGNPEVMALHKIEQPFDSNVSYIHIMDIKECNFEFTRSLCLVRLHSDNPVLQCCRKTSRIIWLDIEQILNDYTCVWGPHFIHFISVFDEEIERVRTDNYIYDDIVEDPLREELLESLKVTERQIKLFYMDFIEHCFPTFLMTFIAFKDYLGKYGFKTSEKSMKRLFNAFFGGYWSFQNPWILFEELLLGLALIDPQSIYNCRRLEFLFRYYDFDRDGYLSKEELREMIEDIHENETSDMIDLIVNDYWFVINPFEEGIDYDEFWESVHNQTIIVPNSLCRFQKRILLKIISTLEIKNRGIVSRIKTFVSHFCSQIFMKNV